MWPFIFNDTLGTKTLSILLDAGADVNYYIINLIININIPL